MCWVVYGDSFGFDLFGSFWILHIAVFVGYVVVAFGLIDGRFVFAPMGWV